MCPLTPGMSYANRRKKKKITEREVKSTENAITSKIYVKISTYRTSRFKTMQREMLSLIRKLLNVK